MRDSVMLTEQAVILFEWSMAADGMRFATYAGIENSKQ